MYLFDSFMPPKLNKYFVNKKNIVILLIILAYLSIFCNLKLKSELFRYNYV